MRTYVYFFEPVMSSGPHHITSSKEELCGSRTTGCGRKLTSSSCQELGSGWSVSRTISQAPDQHRWSWGEVSLSHIHTHTHTETWPLVGLKPATNKPILLTHSDRIAGQTNVSLQIADNNATSLTYYAHVHTLNPS